MLKLADSLPEADQLQSKEPERFSVGNHGWVSIECDHATSLPTELLERWIEESFRLLAPKKLVAELTG